MKLGSLTLIDFQLEAMIPSGWLVDPKGKCLLLFHKNPKNLQRLPKVLMGKWDAPSEATSSQFRNRRKVELEPARETWDELIEHGWRFLAFHEEVA